MKLNDWLICNKDNDKLIVQASTIEEPDGWQSFPIGMSYKYPENRHISQIGNHNQLVLCAFSETTDRERRGNTEINRLKIKSNLEKNNIYNINLDGNTYFKVLPDYKYVISPEGNGIDCHRTYEALIAGCIPILEYNFKIEEKYKNMPILFTYDYTEITKEYLEKKYNDMLENEYDFRKLFIDSYDSNTQEYIKKCGNYWVNKLCGYNWY